MKAWNVFKNDFKIFLSNIRFQIFALVILPLLISFVNGLVLKNVFSEQIAIPKFQVAYIDEDQGKYSKILKEILEDPKVKDLIDLKEVENREESRKKVEKGEYSALVFIPKGFSAGFSLKDHKVIEIVKSPSDSIQAGIVEEIIGSYIDVLNSNENIIEVLAKLSTDPQITQEIIQKALAEVQNTLTNNYIEQGTFEKGKEVDSRQYYAIAMLVMFSLNVSAAGALQIYREKQEGTLTRLRLTGMDKWSFLLGKMLMIFFTLLLQAFAYISLSTLLLKISWGDQILSILLFNLAGAVSIVGLSILGVGLFKNEKSFKSTFMVFLLFMTVLGGGTLPLNQFSEGMKWAARFSISYWMHNGYTNLILGQGMDVLGVHMAILMGLGILGVAIGAVRFKFE